MQQLTEDQLIDLINQAEREAKESLPLYKMKLMLWSLLGYGVIFGIAFLFICLLTSTLYAALFSTVTLVFLFKSKLILAISAAIWIFGRALWVNIERPAGYEITHTDCPELFNQLDELSKKLKSLKIHRVILDDQMNAAIDQYPRLGILGLQENTLLLGVQLLMIQSEEEMRAILAHEMGHLSANNGRFSGWIYRNRYSWRKIHIALKEQNSFPSRLLLKFFDWYVPKFDALSFPLARRHEYESDSIAADLTSPATAARALVNYTVLSSWVHKKYWDVFYAQAGTMPHPPHGPLAGFRRFVQSRLDREAMIENLREAMSDTTEYNDTHPCLKDRLRALGVKPQVPQFRNGVSAGEKWLGPVIRNTMLRFDAIWLENNSDKWIKRYHYVTGSKRKLEDYSSRNPSALSNAEQWAYAELVEEFIDAEASIPLYANIVKRNRHDFRAAMKLGVMLYERNHPKCLECFTIARNDPKMVQDCGEYGYKFYNHHGNTRGAERWRDETKKLVNQYVRMERERLHIKGTLDIKRASISADDLTVLKELLRRNHWAKEAWLAEKRVKHFPQYPVYVLAFRKKSLTIDLHKKGFIGDEHDAKEKIKKLLSGFHRDIIVVPFNADNPALFAEVKSKQLQMI